MPIKDLSDAVRLPRLGKIHLGVKHPEKGYPMKTDHFVLPKDHSDYKKLVEIFGDKPKELRILIPVEDEEQWATQYYKAYNLTYGLVCKGDGDFAMRMVDVKTDKLPNKNTETCAMKEMTCAGRDCPEYQNKSCHEVMNLRFLLPDVPGLGVWQVDTGSINSILNINSCAKVIRKAFGRITMIPLKLTLEPTPVNNPETGKKQTVYVMHLRTDVTLAQLADAAREQAKTFLLEAPDMEALYEMEAEATEDLWGPPPEAEKRAKAEAPKPKPEAKKAAKPEPKQASEAKEVTEKPEKPEPEKPEPEKAAKEPEVWENKIRPYDLKEMLDTLKKKVPKTWGDEAVLPIMKKSYGVEGKNIMEAASKLDAAKAIHFMKKVQEALDMNLK